MLGSPALERNLQPLFWILMEFSVSLLQIMSFVKLLHFPLEKWNMPIAEI
jgi:hypothetical protein